MDDELPDYIMVMVNNDKSQAKIAADLSLFLGKLLLVNCSGLVQVFPATQDEAIPR